MLVTIPTDEELVFLDFRLKYNVVATAGPPDPPLDVRLMGWEFVERWRVNPELPECVETLDKCDTCDVGLESLSCCPWSALITDYYSEHQLELREMCRNFELTCLESMV